MSIFETGDSGYGSPRSNDRFFCLSGSVFQFLIFLFLLTAVPNGFGQFFEYGQDRGTIRWNHFRSEHYQLIYPRGLDSLAMDFADKVEYFYPHQARVLDHEHDMMPVIFHNESSFSNGVFVWAPRRLEVFTNPDPNGYPQDWMTQLALHEGRHAFQVSKLDQGFSKGLTWIAGEQAVGAVTGLLPMWYLEGDAVDAETRFSYTGRGRMPSFEMGMKALLLEGDGRYSFSKAVLGSYRDYVPNHYQLGYLMVRHGRRTYGNDFWNEMEDYAARKPYLVVPSYFSMKKYGVTSKNALYHDALDFYRSHWKASMEKRQTETFDPVSRTGHASYTSYHFPQSAGDSSVIALKKGIDQIPEFVMIGPSGKEKRVFRPGYLNSGRFSYSQGKLVWDEWVPDIRWSNRNFSEIHIYDMHQKKVRSLGNKTRFYSPALSKGAAHVAVTEQRTDHTFYLVILDITGNQVLSARSPGGQFIQHPHWMEQDSAIVVTANNPDGESLYCYSVGNQTWRRIFHSGYHDISFPVVQGSDVYFSSTLSGIDNIYRYSMKDKKLFRMTSAVFGAFEPSVAEGRLFFSDYHAGGYRAVSKALSLSGAGEVTATGFATEQTDALPTPAEQEIIDGIRQAPSGRYTPRPYRKALNAFNLHSWLPLYFDYMNPEAALNPEELPVSLGATILSQNLLSTVTAMAGYEYRDRTHYLHTGVRLKGRYPVFDISLNYGGAPAVYKIRESDIVAILPNRMTLVTNTHIPLRLNTGKFISYVQPLLSYIYTSDIFPNSSRTDYESGLHTFYYKFYMSSYLRMGRRDIWPRLGFSAYTGYKHAPFNAHNFGDLSVAGLTVYLPGPLPHQTVKLQAVSQRQDPERYLFGNEIALPRGYKNIVAMEMQRYSADYHFPIACPDFRIEPVLYIKRIRGNLWADHMVGKEVRVEDPSPDWRDKDFTTFGADLLFDLHVIRFTFPFSMGARMAYLPASQQWVPEFLFTIDVN